MKPEPPRTVKPGIDRDEVLTGRRPAADARLIQAVLNAGTVEGVVTPGVTKPEAFVVPRLRQTCR